MPLALIGYWKEILAGIFLLAFSVLLAHDRVVTAKLGKEKVIASQLQSNSDALAKQLDEQTAAVQQLRDASVRYQVQSRAAVQAANALRASATADEKRIAALQVPESCNDALSFLVRYWRSPAALQP